MAQVGVAQVGSGEVDSGEITIEKRGLPQDRLTKIHSVQLQIGERRPREICPHAACRAGKPKPV
jgi:hypothetical protein